MKQHLCSALKSQENWYQCTSNSSFAIDGFLIVLSFTHTEDIKTVYPIVHFKETNTELKGNIWVRPHSPKYWFAQPEENRPWM